MREEKGGGAFGPLNKSFIWDETSVRYEKLFPAVRTSVFDEVSLCTGMVLILDGNSEIGAQVKSNLC